MAARLRGEQLLERDTRVSEARTVDRVACTDERLDVLVDVPDVDVHAGKHALVLEPEGDELRLSGAPRKTNLSHRVAWPEYSMPTSY